MRFLRERIRLTQKAKADAKKEVGSTSQSVTSALSTEDADRVLELIKINTQRVFNTSKDRQKQKFEKLLHEKQAAVSSADTSYLDKTNWVINLSSRTLNDAEIALLQKGLNFAVTPANVPAKEIIASVESAIRQLNAEQADTVRRTVNSILQQAEPPDPNITEEMRDGLKSLKEDESIMVLPADKGRASVVMDADTYRTKMSTLIENGPYQLLNKDPTDRLTRKLSKELLTLKRNGDLSGAVYNKIRPRHKQPPRIYGLPKIHKADIPLRPIVSCVNTFAYDLSAYLANILSPLTGNSDFTVTISAHFVSTISSETILNNEVMVSFDVDSLFTNVPIDGAVQAQKITKTRKPNTSAEPVAEFKSTAVLPYVKGLSEQLRRCLQQQGVRAVFKSETTLRSQLVRPKDAVDSTKQDGVVYRIPCECGKVNIGETGRPMQDSIKEHDRDIRLARTQTSAVAEHTNNTGHYPLWNEVKLIDRDSHWYTRRVKEAIHIRLHPNNINRDSGIEIPEAWMPTIKKHNNRRTVRLRTAEGATVNQHAEH
ncbi:hypothetical protein ACROYT_G027998 [Oculina patagonica]